MELVSENGEKFQACLEKLLVAKLSENLRVIGILRYKEMNGLRMLKVGGKISPLTATIFISVLAG